MNEPKSAFVDIPEMGFPFTIVIRDKETNEVLFTQEVTGPGAINIPGFQRETIAEVTNAGGTTTSEDDEPKPIVANNEVFLQSGPTGEDFARGLVWHNRLDKRWIMEVQQLPDRTAVLYIWDEANNMKLRFSRQVVLAYGAIFGPDIEDVSAWMDMAIEFVDGLSEEK